MRAPWLGYVFAILAVAASMLVFSRLPPEIPTHWNFRGVPDGYSPRLHAALFGPTAIVLLTVGMQLLTAWQARAKNAKPLPRRFWTVINLVAFFLLVLHAAVLANGVGAPVNVGLIALVGAVMLAVAAPLLLLPDINRKSP